jgi:hypothetical protein
MIYNGDFIDPRGCIQCGNAFTAADTMFGGRRMCVGCLREFVASHPELAGGGR